MEGRKAARVIVASEFTDVTDRTKWPAAVDWLIAAQIRLRRAIDAVGGRSVFGVKP
jgi:hypothetical protein